MSPVAGSAICRPCREFQQHGVDYVAWCLFNIFSTGGTHFYKSGVGDTITELRLAPDENALKPILSLFFFFFFFFSAQHWWMIVGHRLFVFLSRFLFPTISNMTNALLTLRKKEMSRSALHPLNCLILWKLFFLLFKNSSTRVTSYNMMIDFCKTIRSFSTK